MPTRRLLVLLALAAATVLTACGDQATPRGQQASRELLDGGPEAFEARLQELRGKPVVVNQWASWCTPCRREFPFFRDQASKLRGEVAFLGVNSMDNRADAGEFLADNPTGFPHFYDADAEIARVFRGGRAWPTTAFYTATGERAFTHQGAYREEADLARDIRKWALGG